MFNLSVLNTFLLVENIYVCILKDTILLIKKMKKRLMLQNTRYKRKQKEPKKVTT